MMNTIEIQKISITDLDTDAIVNAANEGLWAGGGVCGAIFGAAGYDQLQEACNKIGYCDTGSAVITPGFNLNAKYIIHAVGPRWKDGNHNEPKLLYSAYRSSLQLAVDNGCHSIGFPLISAGIFGYPLEGAWRKALQACHDFLIKNPGAGLKIVFAVLSDSIIAEGEKQLKEIAPEMTVPPVAKKDDWNTVDMPDRNDTFVLHRSFTPVQMSALRQGNIPRAMEDKWFWYMQGNRLYAHRSWTGFCIFIIDFGANNQHTVTVNRDPEQYHNTNIDEDRKTINMLLGWWTKPKYDYYGEFLSETVDTLKKSGQVKDHLKIGNKEVDAVFFHLPEEPNGYLSNWHKAPFTLDGHVYSSTEQYIMYRKCKMFGDDAAAEAVLATDDCAKQQKIGREAKGYVNSIWSGQRQIIALRALTAKFSQNRDLREMLLNTGDSYLVECAHSDRIWACGIRLNDEARHDILKWSGQNLLGFALMEVRDNLKSEEN